MQWAGTPQYTATTAESQERHATAKHVLQQQLAEQRQAASSLAARLAGAEAAIGLPADVEAARKELKDTHAALAAAQRQYKAMRRHALLSSDPSKIFAATATCR